MVITLFAEGYYLVVITVNQMNPVYAFMYF